MNSLRKRRKRNSPTQRLEKRGHDQNQRNNEGYIAVYVSQRTMKHEVKIWSAVHTRSKPEKQKSSTGPNKKQQGVGDRGGSLCQAINHPFCLFLAGFRTQAAFRSPHYRTGRSRRRRGQSYSYHLSLRGSAEAEASSSGDLRSGL